MNVNAARCARNHGKCSHCYTLVTLNFFGSSFKAARTKMAPFNRTMSKGAIMRCRIVPHHSYRHSEVRFAFSWTLHLSITPPKRAQQRNAQFGGIKYGRFEFSANKWPGAMREETDARRRESLLRTRFMGFPARSAGFGKFCGRFKGFRGRFRERFGEFWEIFEGFQGRFGNFGKDFGEDLGILGKISGKIWGISEKI